MANKARGRVISGTVHFRLTPPDSVIGETDAAYLIGIELVREAMGLLKMAAEREGFTVEISYRQVVY